MYKNIKDGIVQRLSDGVFIPLDAENVDCDEYHKWLDAGGIPEHQELSQQSESDM